MVYLLLKLEIALSSTRVKHLNCYMSASELAKVDWSKTSLTNLVQMVKIVCGLPKLIVCELNDINLICDIACFPLYWLLDSCNVSLELLVLMTFLV